MCTGTLLYRDDENPDRRILVCCYKPECRAEYTSTEPEPEPDDTEYDAKALRNLTDKGYIPLKYTSQYPKTVGSARAGGVTENQNVACGDPPRSLPPPTYVSPESRTAGLLSVAAGGSR